MVSPETCPAVSPPATSVRRSRVPLETDSVTRTAAAPASTSAIASPVTASGVFSPVASGPGTVFTGASLTALTEMATVAESVSAPPEPVLPRSSRVRLRLTLPLLSGSGRKVRPEAARVAEMAATGASTMTAAELLPETSGAVTPLATSVRRISSPPVTESVRRTGEVPESMSVTLRPVGRRSVSSLVVAVAGAVRIGPSLTALTLIEIVSESVCSPPAPVLPRSLVVSVMVALPLKFDAGWRVRPFEEARVLLIAARGAVMVRPADPLPTTWPAVTPAVTAVSRVSVPVVLTSETWMLALPASTSAIERPGSASATSSSVAKDGGAVLTGGSLTAVTVIATVSMSVAAPPEPVLPWSLVVTVSRSAPLKSASGR